MTNSNLDKEKESSIKNDVAGELINFIKDTFLVNYNTEFKEWQI